MYTLQKEIDVFSGRWGCYFTCCINLFEHSAGKKMDMMYIEQILGKCLLDRSVLLANYKNYRTALTDPLEPAGWGDRSDPNWHYYVMDPECLYDNIKSIFPVNTKDAKILNIRPGHFVLKIAGDPDDIIINPDPDIPYSEDRIISERRIRG